MKSKVSNFGKIFTLVFNIVFIGLIICSFYYVSKLALLSLATIFSFGMSSNLNTDFEKTTMMFNIICVLYFILPYVWSAVCLWGIFKKTKTKQTKALIPIYNVICLVKEIMESSWYTVLFIIPIINFIFPFIFMYKLGKCFSKTSTYCTLLMLFPTALLPLLAYDNSEYKKETINFNNKLKNDFQKSIKNENPVLLFFKWFLSIILLLIGILLFLICITPSEGEIAIYLINAFFFTTYGLLACPLVTHYTMKYQKYTKMKKIIVAILLAVHFIVFCCYFSFRW